MVIPTVAYCDRVWQPRRRLPTRAAPMRSEGGFAATLGNIWLRMSGIVHNIFQGSPAWAEQATPINLSCGAKMIMANLRRILAGLGFLLLFTACGGQSPAHAQRADSLDLERYRGAVVYVDFWASWCVPCRKSFPWMNAIQAKFGESGFVIIAVNVDHDRAAAEKFLEKYPANFSVIYDPEGKLAEAYQLEAMPSSFLYSRDGKRMHSYLGFQQDETEQVEAAIKELLNQPRPDLDEPAVPAQ